MAIRINGDNTAAAPGITANDDTDTGVHFGTDEVNIVTGGTQQVKVDSSGRLLIGTDSSVNVASTAASLLQVEHVAGNISASFYSTVDAVGPAGVLALGHGRGSATGLLQNDDVLGQIRFAGGDGTDLVTTGAQISAEVDGTPGANDMPGRLIFSVTPDGGSSPVERMRISNNGRFHTNAVTQYFDRGSTSGNSSFSRDFQLGSSQTAIIFMGFSHYGHVNNYGCCRIDFAATGASFTPDNVHNQTSGAGGSWSISKPNSSTIRVSKNAGTYSGSGGWFIHVLSS